MSKKTKQQKQKQDSIKKRILKLLFLSGLWASILLAGYIIYCALTMPPLEVVTQIKKHPNIILLDQNNIEFARYGESFGEYISSDQIPDPIKAAVLSIEDHRFYEHFGFDIIGFSRAMSVNLSKGRFAQGGSTITQQLAKNLFLKPDRTIKRKVQELLIAFWLEYHFSKDEILAAYLNRVYLGAGTYGMDAASQLYFRKSIDEADYIESALLAGLLKAPSRYSPTNNHDLAIRRGKVVLNAMVNHGYLPAEILEQALPDFEVLSMRKILRNPVAGYFADWVMSDIAKYNYEYFDDLIVQTSLDLTTQIHADKILNSYLTSYGEKRQITQGAVLIMDKDGYVKALVGGADYKKSQFNRIIHAKRQPGSAIKPIIYLEALRQGLTLDTKLDDKPIDISGWAPNNYAKKFEGEVTLEQAFIKSKNIPSINLLKKVGIESVIKLSRQLGITSPLRKDLTFVLGTNEMSLMELTTAYSVFANGGALVWPQAIKEIKTHSGELLFSNHGGTSVPFLSPEVNQELQNLFINAVSDGTGKRARLKNKFAKGKTGTSQNYRDALFIGFDNHLITSVWLGNDDNSPMINVTGGLYPAMIWKEIMEQQP